MSTPVAFAVSRFPASSETFIAAQIRALLEAGVPVEVWSRWESPELTPEWRRPDFRRRSLPEGAAALLAAARLEWSAWAALRSRPPSISSQWSVAVRAGAHRRAPRYGLVLAHFGLQGLDALDLRRLGRLQGPLAVVFHGFDVSSYVDEKGRDVYRELFEEADLLLPISERWQNRLLELGAPKEKLRVHRMGVDLQSFAFAPRTWARGQPLRLISVARLVEKKGLHIAIPAVAELAKEVPDLRWDVIGDGPMRGSLTELATQHQAPVTFHGARPHDEVRTKLADAHVFLGPSVTSSIGDQEGIPVALMEAMAAGLPVVSTRHSGIPELVQPGTGRLAEEGDVDSVLAELRGALDDAHEGRWPEILSAARARVAEAFDQARWNARLVEMARNPS